VTLPVDIHCILRHVTTHHAPEASHVKQNGAP